MEHVLNPAPEALGLDREITFLVPGWPATKGSTISFAHKGRIVTKTDSVLLKSWSKAVAVYAINAGIVKLAKGTGVAVDVEYEFPRPVGVRRETPCVRPDCDKLARALLDALTGIAYHDDGQVVELRVRKCYVGAGRLPLARVKVGPA